jgi:hypothetical protein
MTPTAVDKLSRILAHESTVSDLACSGDGEPPPSTSPIITIDGRITLDSTPPPSEPCLLSSPVRLGLGLTVRYSAVGVGVHSALQCCWGWG